jgi:hypothetical protein
VNQKSLKAYLVSHIKPLDFYEDFFGAGLVKWKPGWTDVFCPFHNPQWKEQQGKSPSFGIHIESGAFRCASAACGLHGQHVVNFYDQFNAYSFEKTLRQLYHRWVQPVVSAKLIEEWHTTLMDSPSVLKYVTDKRGVPKPLVKRFRLGFDGDRITIPIYDKFGLAVDVRRYDFAKQFKAKIISYKKDDQGYGTARLFPIDNLMATKGRLVLCEGEWDTMLAIARGYTAITVTSGAGNWPKAGGPNDVLELFRGRPVRIIYDFNDVSSDGSASDAGQIGAQRVAEVLAPLAKSVKIVVLPIKKSGGDITDWFMHYGKSKAELDQLIDATPEYSRTDEVVKPTGTGEPEASFVRLDQAADAQYYYKPIEMECLVSGKDLSPYLAPKKIKATITDPKTGDKNEETYDIDTQQNKHMLELINCATGKQQSALREMVDLPGGEGVKLETLETFNMEELRLIPSINLRDMEGAYTIRRAVYIGHGLESNRTYKMRGYTLPDPSSQSCVHVITKADPVQDTVENFKLTDEIKKRLTEKFNPGDDVKEHMHSIVDWLSRHHTHIRMRPDLHIAIDLVFHSPMTFNFNGEEVTKGWLELLVIGDTRCGKGYVAERLSKFYRLGETVTGENCSFSGLIGGLQKNDEHWFVTWGKIPLNDKRLVIIDEASAIKQEEMGRFSRVRSEGIAEIIKIITERTRARTRLIWLSNPRSGKPLNTYNHGVEAVSELFGNTEDVARLDLAVTVATSEVPSRVINSPPIKSTDGERYTQSDFTNLILWAWSRKAEQVEFTPRATQMILKEAVVMGRKYSPTVPLIQAENVRIKIAKVAAATAARCFSCDETGEKLIVKSQHVQFACDFINQVYSKESMGYDVYSSTAINQGTLPDEHTIENTIRGLKRYAEDFVSGLMERRTINYDDIADFTGMDRFEAQSLVGKLVRMRCLSKEGHLYTKRPSFSTLLQSMQKRMKEEARS